MKLMWLNEEQTMGSITSGSHTIIVELGHPLWDEFVKSNLSPYVPPPLPTEEEALSAKRAAMTLTFAQLLIGLVAEGWITELEGEGWLDGKLPAAFNAMIAGLPRENQFAAKARAKRPSQVLRNDGLVNALAAMQGKTPTELDAFFIKYAGV